MTKKHYIAIAHVLKTQLSNPNVYSVEDVCRTLAHYFATDNPKFDRQRFLDACGIKEKSQT